MRRLNWKKMSVEEIGAVICSFLDKNGMYCVLSGGSCVSIYSNNRYKSQDFDFVMAEYSRKKVDEILAELGFIRTKGWRHYENKDCPYLVEFPPTPLSIGEEIVSTINEIKNRYGVLRLLTPTDCVKDRLAAFYHWNDNQAFEQALMVAFDQKINMSEVKRWSENEQMIEKFNEFKRRLKGKKKKSAR